MDHHRETKADKRDSNDFYERGDTNTKPEGIEYGVSKLEDVKINAIEVQALRPTEQDLELVNEELRIQEAVLDRQEMQLDMLAVYHEECLEYGKSPIEWIESIFSAEHERDIVVLCRSQEEADFASENFQQEGSVFVSLGDGTVNDRDLSIEESIVFERELENDVDLSILEGRKVLVWGDELERISTLEKFQGDYVNMHVREIDFDFVLDDPADFREADAKVVSGSLNFVLHSPKSFLASFQDTIFSFRRDFFAFLAAFKSTTSSNSSRRAKSSIETKAATCFPFLVRTNLFPL